MLASLRSWFCEEKRDLPWRHSPSPYAVWVSEVMLQQTRAAVVVDYFIRWMERFPTIAALATASREEVIKAWEGLGYYARARYLHDAARCLVRENGGQLPCTKEALQKLRGLGPYTVGAILSFAFHQKAACVDGNVTRVIARLFCVEERCDTAAGRRRVRDLVENLLPDEEPWVIMEALIELGARICGNPPDCFRCPLGRHCRAHRLGVAISLPHKKQRGRPTPLSRFVGIVQAGQSVLVRKEEDGGLMQDLYQFPYLEKEKHGREEDMPIVERFLGELLGERVRYVRDLPPTVHHFTRFKAHLYPSVWSIPEPKRVSGHEWVSLLQAATLPFSSGHRRILQGL